MSKRKKVLDICVFISIFETYARYSWVTDKEKKSLRSVKGAIRFLNSIKGAIWKKSLGNPAFKRPD